MADVERERVTALWREAAAAVERRPGRHERDYIERTIATVRNHRDADNCWPQWANIFADEIEAGWAECGRLREQLEAARQALERIAALDGHPTVPPPDYRDFAIAIARAALGVEGEQENPT